MRETNEYQDSDLYFQEEKDRLNNLETEIIDDIKAVGVDEN